MATAACDPIAQASGWRPQKDRASVTVALAADMASLALTRAFDFVPEPPLGSILYLHTLPPLGGDTIFASMYAAYDALSPFMKEYLSRLTATHDGALVFNRFNRGKKYPISVHPVITQHPATGRKVIFVNRSFTSHINEVPERESKAVLNLLYDHLESPLYQMRFHWEPHSIAFWDNRCTQHYAMWDYYPATRSGYRVQIEGQKPIAA